MATNSQKAAVRLGSIEVQKKLENGGGGSFPTDRPYVYADKNIPIDFSLLSTNSEYFKPQTETPIFDCNVYSLSSCFLNWWNLREAPVLYSSSGYVNKAANVFKFCYSLRNVPQETINIIQTKSSSTTSSPYYFTFYNCFCIDEITNYPVNDTSLEYTNNMFNSFIDYCMRLKSLTFALGEDGQPQTWKAKNQTLELWTFIGCGYGWNDDDRFTDYNSGITRDKNICFDESSNTYYTTIDQVQAKYDLLKDDPDYFVNSRDGSITYDGINTKLAILFSRYNHDSAVETIRTLPDTSAYLETAGGTNTIKFKNYSGALTDGGGINDLTEEEIAVAAAKGWTVSIVN